MVSAALIFVVPAILIALIFPCTYSDVVTSSIYVAFMGIMSLMAAAAVIDDLDKHV
jgi:hypothetical protein